MKFLVLLLIFAILVSADKGLTLANIIVSQKNFPEQLKDNPYHVEKNPLNKKFFEWFGLFGGTLVYWIVSVATLFGAFYLLRIPFGEIVSLYIITILYGFVIANNFFFFFKFSKYIP